MDFEKFKYIRKCNIAGFVPDSIAINSCDYTVFLDIRKAVNFGDVSEAMENINGCAVRFLSGSDFKIIQVFGYSPARGLFYDLY